MLTSTQICPHCGKSVHLTLMELCEVGGEPIRDQNELAQLTKTYERMLERGTPYPAEYPTNKRVYDDPVNLAGLAICPRCASPVMLTFVAPRLFFLNHTKSLREATRTGPTTEIPDPQIRMHPSPKKPQSDPDWPDTVRTLFADVQAAAQQGLSPIMIVSSCRTVLESCLKELGANGANNYKRIEDLLGRGMITKSIAEWAHELRDLGNDATHDAKATHEEAAVFIEFLVQFMTVLFSMPARIQHRQKGRVQAP